MDAATRSQLRHSTPTLVGGRAKPMVSADYIVGLTDGEGCFYFFRRIRYRAVPSKETSKLFVEVARLVQQGVHHTQDGIRQIQYLKSQMNHRTRVVREIRTLRGNTK